MQNAEIPHLEEQLAYLATATDADIDFSDIPEIKDFSRAIRGRFYIPAKEEITLLIDTDILAWFKGQNTEYQTAINQVLRDYMTAKLAAASS